MFEFAFVGIAAGGGQVSVASAWANISGTSEAVNADKTINGTGTLTATISGYSVTGGNAGGLNVYVNSVLVGSVTAGEGAVVSVSVNNGDAVHFGATKGLAGSGTSGAWTVTTNAGASFTVSVNAAP